MRCALLLAAVSYVAQTSSAFQSPASLRLRSAGPKPCCPVSKKLQLRMGKDVFDVNPEGEERHHPYFDAPEDRIASAGKLHVNEAPPDVKPMDNFRRNHPDFDSPPEKMLEAGNLKGKGVAAAVGGDIDSPVFEPAFFDAPLEKIAEAGNLHVNERPPDVKPMDDFRRRHPDFDAPVEKMIEAGNVQPSEFAMKKTVTGSGDVSGSS